MIYSLTLLAAATAYALSRMATVSIRKDDRWRVELSFTLLAFTIYPKKKKGRSLPRGFGRLMLRRILRLIERCDATLHSLTPPRITRRSSAPPYRGYGLVGAGLAALASRTRSTTAADEAFILSPDTSPTLDLRFDVRLFYLVLSSIGIVADLVKTKFAR